MTNDAALGNTTGVAASIGQVELNSGTFQAGASFAAPERNFFLGSGSNFDVAGFTTTFGTLTDVQRTLDIVNSNTTTAGAVTFSNLTIGATSTLQLAGGTAGETVTLTNGIVRTGNDTLVIQPTSGMSLGTATEKVLSGVGAASLVNMIAPAYIVTNNGVSTGPYDFVTYGANGYVKATYSATALTNTPTATVALAANATPAGNVSAFALNTGGNKITLGAANSLTLGDGTNPGGLILASGSAISNGTLAFGGSEGVIWLSGTNPTISFEDHRNERPDLRRLGRRRAQHAGGRERAHHDRLRHRDALGRQHLRDRHVGRAPRQRQEQARPRHVGDHGRQYPDGP